MSIVVPCGVVVKAYNLEIVIWNLGEYKQSCLFQCDLLSV